MAMKVISINGTDKTLEDREIRNLQKCQHANVVQYFGYESVDKREIRIFMEFCEMSLRNFVPIKQGFEYDIEKVDSIL